MTDGRYDSRRGQYDSPRGSSDRDRSNRDDRGFFDRARDEVSSWFGDDDPQRGHDHNDRSDHSGRNSRNYESYEQSPRYRDEGHRRPYTGPNSGGSGSDDDHRGPTSQNMDRGQNFDRGSAQRASSRGAPSGGSQGRHDPDYSQWRSRQIDELDRDYDEFRRENQSRFDSEFTTWRGQRQSKRQLLANVTEHMDVVGSDGQPVGKVDHVRPDRIILTKNDSPDGRHHSIVCSKIDRVEDGKVVLDKTADEARREFSDDLRNRALFERDDQGEDGPHVLNRSFSGTY